MNPTKNKRSREWKAITIEEIEKRFHKDFFQDIKALVLYCKNRKMEWTIDVQKQDNLIMIFFVSEDVSWIYEIESEKSQYYRQIYLARDDLHYLLRRMNEKRKIRKV
jgi:arabinogalactan endo-1,4-beta-galactosidase